MGLAQHGQQGMMAGPSVLARVMSLERTFLLAIALEYGGIQIQRVALTAPRHPLHLPFRQRLEQALWGQREKIRLLRADSGFFDDKLLSFLEQRLLPYIVVAKLTPWVKREAQRVEQWTVLDDNYATGEFRLKLLGWSVERRFAVIRERVREGRDSVGRKLIDVPGYTFRVFVTSLADAPQEIWHDYNQRADMENRIAELKHDLGADGFCMKQFFATEAAFRSVLLLFNLLSEFQRAAGLRAYREPATLRTQVLTCGAILGRAGRRLVVHLSQSWGGLKTRIPLFDSILNWQIPTSPKLDPALTP